MLLLKLLLLVAPAVFAASVRCKDATQGNDYVSSKDDIRNANHIFNAIHSSMRQFGSSWNHNGVSYFLATVPANTEFYHGRPSADPVKGIEWLAFEPEHALWFASMGGPPPGGPGHRPDHPSAKSWKDGREPKAPRDAQRPLNPPGDHDGRPGKGPPHGPPGFPSRAPGYVHTYRTKHALSLLYIDGLSGSKSSLGTLDSQDFGLLDWDGDDGAWLREEGSSGSHHHTEREPPHLGGPPVEQRRAMELCAIAQDKWSSKIDGFIRAELGFEIILCDFEKHLETVDVLRTAGPNDSLANNANFYNDQFQWYRSVAQRFDSIGAGRVVLNHDDFVTGFAYDDMDLFPDGEDSNPRMRHLDTTQRQRIRDDVDAMVLRNDTPFKRNGSNTDWQAVADMIVTRYGGAIPYFAGITNLTNLRSEIQLLMRPFIDFSTRNVSSEIERCTNHFLPPSLPASESLISSRSASTAQRAVTSISHYICNTMFSTLYLPSTSPIDISENPFVALGEYLDWTTWRHCTRLCSYDEVCFIPIWPLGTMADRDRGMGICRNATEFGHGMGMGRSYWGMPTFGPPPDESGRGNGQ